MSSGDGRQSSEADQRPSENGRDVSEDGRDESEDARDPAENGNGVREHASGASEGDALHLESLDVVRAPGFQSRGFQVEDLSGGINVVHGPNASGKTTLALSIQELLWPGEVRAGTELVGRLSVNGDDWRIETRDGRASYQRNGQDANGPGLPPAEERDRYHLCLTDLLDDDTTDESFAATIERESAGGYDLSAAANELGFDDSPSTRRIGEVSEAESAVEAWRDARSEMEALRSEEQRLATLRSDLEAARDATQRVELLEQAIEHAEATDELEAAEAALSEFPEILESVDGDEAETVADVDDEIAGWEDELEAAEADREAAQAAIEEADLPDEGVSDGLLERVKTLASQLGDLERDRDDRRTDLEEARSKREHCLEEIPLDVDEATLADLDPASWGEVSAFVRDAEQLRSDRAEYESTQQWLRERETPDRDRSTLREGRTALENWLKTQDGTSTEPNSAPLTGSHSAPLLIGTLSALLLGVAGVTLGYLVHPALYLFAAAGLGLGAYGYVARETGTDETDQGTAHRVTYEDLDLEPPDSWEPEAVRRRLTEVYDDLAAHELDRLVEERRQALEADLADLESRADDLRERRAELRERFGIDVDVSDLELLVFAKGVLRWQEHNDRVVGLERTIEEIDARIDETRTDLDEALGPFGYDSVDDAVDAEAHITDLESRGTRHAEARRDLESAETQIETATERIEALEAEREAIFAEVGLDSGELDRLRELCEQSDAYEDAAEAVHDAKIIFEREAERLEAYPEFEPDMTTRSVPDLEREKRRAEETAATYDDVHEEITAIETKIDEAKADSEVEEAIAEKRRALDSLREELAADRAAMVGNVLTDHVREATGETNRPAVFERAREILARITHGRYELDVDDRADGSFRAYDTVREQGFALDELSSGTRLQVLLAVRIAFVEHQEQGEQLPLILDETLANTDDGKAEVVIESLLELARGGRQVCYFTAQGDEVGKWRAALEDVDDVDYREIDLSTVRDLDERIRVPDLGALDVRPASPPNTGDHDHASYGEALDVDPFDPRLGAGGAHLWYVVADVDLLSQLLDQGIDRWGKLRTLLTTVGRAALVDDPERLEPVERNGRALETFVDSWETGRGEPVDRQVLEDSSAVSETFIDRVSDLAADLHGDGERIVDALRAGEVDRFRSGKTDQLEAYLEENGYVESVEPLEPEAIRLRVVNSYVEDGVDREVATERADALLDRLDGG